MAQELSRDHALVCAQQGGAVTGHSGLGFLLEAFVVGYALGLPWEGSAASSWRWGVPDRAIRSSEECFTSPVTVL